MKKTTLFFVLISYCLCLFSQKVVTDRDIYLPGENVSFRILTDNKTPIKDWKVSCFDNEEKIILFKEILFRDNSLSFSFELPWEIQQGEYRLTFENSETEQTTSAHIFVLFPKDNKIQLQCEIDSLISLKSSSLKFSLLLKSDVNENVKVTYKIIRDNKVITKAKSKIVINKPEQLTIAGIEFIEGDLLSFSYSFQKKKYSNVIPIKFIDSKSNVTFAVEGETLIENKINKVGFLSVGCDLKPLKRNFKLMNSNNQQLMTFENVAAANFEFTPLPNTSYFLVDQYGNKYDFKLRKYRAFKSDEIDISISYDNANKIVNINGDFGKIKDNSILDIVDGERVLPFIKWINYNALFLFNDSVIELINNIDINGNYSKLYLTLNKYNCGDELFICNKEDDIIRLFNYKKFCNLHYNNGMNTMPKIEIKEAYKIALEKGTPLLDVIRIIKPYTVQGELIFFRGVNSIMMPEGALIVLDGTILGTHISDLSFIDPKNVDKLKVSTEPKDILKYSGVNSVGLIEITTKKGDMEKNELDISRYNQSVNQLNTLLWLPNLDLTKTSKVAIGEQNQKGQYVIRVTGIDSNSNIHYANRKIKID